MKRKEIEKLSKSFPVFSEERICLLQICKQICSPKEKKIIINQNWSNEQLKKFIEKNVDKSKRCAIIKL